MEDFKTLGEQHIEQCKTFHLTDAEHQQAVEMRKSKKDGWEDVSIL